MMKTVEKMKWSNNAGPGVSYLVDLAKYAGNGIIPRRAISCLTAQMFSESRLPQSAMVTSDCREGGRHDIACRRDCKQCTGCCSGLWRWTKYLRRLCKLELEDLFSNRLTFAKNNAKASDEFTNSSVEQAAN